MYFEGDPLIAQDFEIAKAPEELRHLLIARSEPDPKTGFPLYTFDITLAKAGTELVGAGWYWNSDAIIADNSLPRAM